jgi:alpha,alpha-trehalase
MSAGRDHLADGISPERCFEELFTAVQTSGLLADSKTFVDAIPQSDPATILARYRQAKQAAGFDLRQFVEQNFELPPPAGRGLGTDPERPVEQYIDDLWDALTRKDADALRWSTLIALPEPYIVPGGRFREIYYWDSYFSMLGLAEAGRVQQVEQMVVNFAYLIDTVGFVPNGNRHYFRSRSQPPFFALMVELLAEQRNDEQVLIRFLPQLEAEYKFWMRPGSARAVAIDGQTYNRYWDDATTPRPESYAEDLVLANGSSRPAAELCREIRAACESGWDFSSRWLAEPHSMDSIRTTRVLPVELNCLLHELERVLARARRLNGDADGADRMDEIQSRRAECIRQRFFSAQHGFFIDLLLPRLEPAPVISLAGMFPLFCGIATDEQAAAVAARLRADFLQAGGWQTTLVDSGQQWDAPSGWAPLQWICLTGLRRYGFEKDALEGAQRWVDNNLAVYAASGRLMERYDVVHVGHTASGGEYKVQDGFGWTNGVLRKLLSEPGIQGTRASGEAR